MKRRDLLKGALAAGAVPAALHLSATDAADRRKTESNRAARPNQAIVVEGLFAGAIRSSHLEGMKKGGVHCGVAGGPRDMASYAELLRFFDAHRAELVHAKSVADIRRARAEGKISNVFCWQYADGLGSAFNDIMGSPKTPLRAFQEIGLRIIGLCYNVANLFGAGNLEPKVGLTRAGRRLVEEIHSLRMVLDVGGHTGEQTSLDAIAMSSGVPVICTHTNIASIANNPRCTSDRVIDAIAGTGGVIGITAVSDFHVRGDGFTGKLPQVDIEKHLDQYDYIKKRVGVDHVGMGTDFVDGMSIPYGGGINPEIIPPDVIAEPWMYVKGFESIDQLPNLIAGLRRRGWTQEEIDKAMGHNWLRVYEKVWGA